MERKFVVVTGIVQGVGFRFSAQREAERLGVTGRVRNRNDGSVEVAVQGTAQRVADMLRWLRTGPESANVRSFEVTDVVPVDDETQFSITG
ncbi:acylphosphatase [Paramicrobacterium fandaimingii]|uniref:acylphosphatase n=1 Tax=Paramicrobacterium fandaimingii TaxID=2708079 RepID=UPI00141F864F|nr:acylphosphatase [Microbacterium fandaimingii]